MKIAVIGSGISGMGAALALSDHHDVTLLERDNRFGGHAHTVTATVKGRDIPVDTGFIVYNDDNYPNLVSLFDHLDVPVKASDMSFAMSVKGGRMEYGCDNYDQLFAQRRNLLNPFYVNGMREILRWNKEAPVALASGAVEGMSLQQFLDERKFSRWFRECFLLPFAGAIWSTPTVDILRFPAANLIHFFRNHELTNGMNPQKKWRTVDGGSREYVTRLLRKLGPRAICGIGVEEISRTGGQPTLTFSDGSKQTFDQVIIATHGPQARGLLTDMDAQEREILGAFNTSQNHVVLHSDPSLMPHRRKIWASWNFLSGGGAVDAAAPAPITYWMNRLQGIDRDYPLFVSLNPGRLPDPALIHGTYSYAHPMFDKRAFEAQEESDMIQGRGGVWYAGAWLGYGFHEDGLTAALRVCAALGTVPDWARDLRTPIATPLARAAE